MKFLVNSLFILILVTAVSCAKQNNEVEKLLTKAQLLAEYSPAEALILLDSVAIQKQTLPEKLYMQYLVTKSYVNFMNGKDISGDIEIQVAIDYFEENRDEEQLTLAYLYAGNVFNQREEREKAFRYYVEAANLANKNKNKLVEAKSLNNIGAYFLKNNLKDSANIYWEQSVILFRKLDNKRYLSFNLYELGFLNYLKKKKDLAEMYGNEALDISLYIDNKKAISYNQILLGLVARENREYEMALKHFKDALSNSTTYIDSTKCYMGFVETLVKKGDLDSATVYLDTLKQHMVQTEELYTSLSIQDVLAKYYSAIGNETKAQYHKKLGDKIDKLIEDKKITDKLFEIKKDVMLEYIKKAESQKRDQYLYITATVVVMIVVAYLFRRTRFKKQIKYLEDEIDRIKKKDK